MKDEDFGTILVCAVRYALGRRTYMPSLVTEWIMSSCHLALDKKTLGVMLRDVEEQGKRGPEAYGDSWDETTWKRFAEWCRKELEWVQ